MFTVIYKKRAIFNRIFQFASKCRLKLFLFKNMRVIIEMLYTIVI